MMDNSIEGFHVQGFVRVSKSSSSKQIVIELKSDSNVWDQICGFCYNPSSRDVPNKPPLSTHCHSLQGSFSVLPDQNHLKLTISDCGKENWPISETNSRKPGEKTVSPGVQSNESEKTVNSGILQYEVDGKVYELKSGVNKRKTTKSKKNVNDPENPSIAAIHQKPLEYVIEDQIFSVDSKSFEETSTSSQADQINQERALETLQVTLMDKCIIPQTIMCGPDTSVFLQNMKELAKLVGASHPSFKCEQCGEQLSSYFPYIEHAFKHFGTRPYVCAVCQSAFQTRGVMRHHLDMHGGKAPFQCEFCGKKFRNSCHMKQHRMRHTGEKPHPCPQCDKTFAHKNVLKIHMQSHTGEKPCCCDLCGKLFREPHRLACHLATHYRANKAVECQDCGKKFKSSGMLTAHSTKRCKRLSTSLTTKSSEFKEESPNLTTLQNAAFITAVDESDELGNEQEVAIIEAETLDDGTMSVVLPANAYIVEPVSDVGAMLVQVQVFPEEAS